MAMTPKELEKHRERGNTGQDGSVAGVAGQYEGENSDTVRENKRKDKDLILEAALDIFERVDNERLAADMVAFKAYTAEIQEIWDKRATTIEALEEENAVLETNIAAHLEQKIGLEQKIADKLAEIEKESPAHKDTIAGIRAEIRNTDALDEDIAAQKVVAAEQDAQNKTQREEIRGLDAKSRFLERRFENLEAAEKEAGGLTDEQVDEKAEVREQLTQVLEKVSGIKITLQEGMKELAEKQTSFNALEKTRTNLHDKINSLAEKLDNPELAAWIKNRNTTQLSLENDQSALAGNKTLITELNALTATEELELSSEDKKILARIEKLDAKETRVEAKQDRIAAEQKEIETTVEEATAELDEVEEETSFIQEKANQLGMEVDDTIDSLKGMAADIKAGWEEFSISGYALEVFHDISDNIAAVGEKIADKVSEYIPDGVKEFGSSISSGLTSIFNKIMPGDAPPEAEQEISKPAAPSNLTPGGF